MTEPPTPVATTVFEPHLRDAPTSLRRRDGPVAPSAGRRQVLQPLASDGMSLDRTGLLGGWQARNAEVTLPHCLDQLEASGALANLRHSRDAERPHIGMWFSDSDVYKTLEAMAWQLTVVDDSALVEAFDEIVDVIVAAQDVDGYVNSYFQRAESARRWSELSTSHELYCAGHLIQAAVAADRVGVGDRLMRVARRFADLIVREFGPGGRDAVCGHPEIETAMVELFRHTGHRPYLATAQRFITLRGHGLLGDGQFGAAYFQDHVPVAEAGEFTGHAVRQLYLLSGVVDVAVETGDEVLLSAAERLWMSAFSTKTYVTGGHGSRHRDESIGDAFELPSDRAYAETCAAIGSFQWNWRMLLATGEHRYAEEMERVVYNAIGGATALDGRHFFYSNPLHLRTGHDFGGEDAPSQRLPWYACACCPPNLARLMGSLHCYLATTDDSGLQIHQYTAGTIDVGPHHVEIATDYPWQGTVRLTVQSSDDRPWPLSLRVPAWCIRSTALIDGVSVDDPIVGGYLRLTRVWSGQIVELQLDMPPRMIAPHPRIDAIRGCVALARGPLVYGIEQVDTPAGLIVEDITLDARILPHVDDRGPGAAIRVMLTGYGRGYKRLHHPLYHALDGSDGIEAANATELPVRAVPYFLWGNRQAGAMRVWVPAISIPAEENYRRPDSADFGAPGLD